MGLGKETPAPRPVGGGMPDARPRCLAGGKPAPARPASQRQAPPAAVPCGRASSHHRPSRTGSRCRCCGHPLRAWLGRGIRGLWRAVPSPAGPPGAACMESCAGLASIPTPVLTSLRRTSTRRTSNKPLTAGWLLHKRLADALAIQFHIVLRLHKSGCRCAGGEGAALTTGPHKHASLETNRPETHTHVGSPPAAGGPGPR